MSAAAAGPSMPGAVRICRRSIAIMLRMGYSRRQAAALVLQVCDGCVMRCRQLGRDSDIAWFTQIAAEARRIRDTSRNSNPA